MVRWSTASPSPSGSTAHPTPCVRGTTPSMLSKPARASGWMSRRKASATAWTTVAEQFTVLITPMKLRVPTRPFARRMPRKVAGSSTYLVGRDLVEGSTWRSNSSMRRLCVCTCAPDAMSVLATPITCPYRSTRVPAGMSRVATLWPDGIRSTTATSSLSSRSPGLRAWLATTTSSSGCRRTTARRDRARATGTGALRTGLMGGRRPARYPARTRAAPCRRRRRRGPRRARGSGPWRATAGRRPPWRPPASRCPT